MTHSNVIQLPRPRVLRPPAHQFGLYFRVGWNQHVDLMEVLAAGEHKFHGLIVDAGSATRHEELVQCALSLGLDVALDPKTHPMALPGGYTDSMADLPWGPTRPHSISDFAPGKDVEIAKSLVDFSVQNRFTQLLGPTHILSGVNDPWLRSDLRTFNHVKREIEQAGTPIQLLYPLTVPIKVLRDKAERAALVAAISDAPMDALWLRIENFGSDATGDKTTSYIDAARDFHQLGIPIVADFVGGVSSVGLLAFGAVGGIAQGITLFEGYKISHWKKPRREGRGGMPSTRIHLSGLDMHLPLAEADAFLRSSTRTRAAFGCTDTHCCPGGVSDMLNNPMKHLVHQRSNLIEKVAQMPESLRADKFVGEFVRPVADNVSAAASLGAISAEMRKRLLKKQKAVGLFRDALENFAKTDSIRSAAEVPLKRPERIVGR